MLDDLAAWDAGVTPFLYDLPNRVRRILLEKSDPSAGKFLGRPRDESLADFIHD